MKKVFKYDIAITDYQTIEMPQGAELLKVDNQNGRIELWALVDPNAETEKRKFRLAGTGHKITDEEASKLRYVGTCILAGGGLVFHLFEIEELNF